MPVMGDRRAPEPTVFERSRPSRHSYSLPTLDVPELDPAEVLAGVELTTVLPGLPEVAELDLVRHFTRLSQRNHGIDVGFYPLGSCSMKYNPRLAETVAAMSGFRELHPWAPESQIQGTLELLWQTERLLSELTGMPYATFQPAAGAHGELCGLMLIRAYHEDRGDARRTIVVPDSAHGTNPASAAMCGYEVVTCPSRPDGLVDVDALAGLVDEHTAGLMLTNPNTLGLFEVEIARIAEVMHKVGALLYYDGANFNAICGQVRPGDMGFDVVHLNVHKTFATPHGGGGPGAGPVLVAERLAPYLPGPVVARADDGSFAWRTPPKSIGRLHGFHGNIGILVRAWSYLVAHGADGLPMISALAVLNANYVAAQVKDVLPLYSAQPPMHEFVSTGVGLKAHGVRVTDLCKRLIDLGYHPPTNYFPLIVEEALMVEPTETESRETLDDFAAALRQIVEEAASDPQLLHDAPVTTPVGRLDEGKAGRELVLRWTPEHEGLKA